MKNHLQLILLAACLVALWPLSSCEPAPEDPKYTIDQETRDYCLFKEGSWWVYMSPTKNIDDSLYCHHSEESDLVDNKFYGAIISYNQMLVRSDHYGKNYFFTNEICSRGEHEDSVQQRIMQGIVGVQVSSFNIYFSTLKWDYMDCGPSNASIFYLGSFEHFMGFENVHGFEARHPSLDYPRTIYWAKNIGIIKKVMPDGTEWTLKRYHVIQ